jgi:excisionase family DNA binding protein
MPHESYEDRKTLTVEEAARELGIGRGLAYEGVRTGAIPAVRVGRRLLVPRAALDRLLAGDAAARPARPFPAADAA